MLQNGPSMGMDTVCKVSVPVVQEVEQIVDVPTVKHRQRWVERFLGSGFGARGCLKRF